MHCGDLTETKSLIDIISKIKPNEIYNLAAQSHVGVSFEIPEYTGEVDALGTLRLLEAVRACGLEKYSRFYQASTSELFGKARETPQTETTPFYPRSPYAVAKQYAFWIVVNYRQAYGMFAVNGILFNHESPRRGPEFVTRKTTIAVAKIANGSQDCLCLGNLDSQRDWGHAKDYVYGMWLMLQASVPDDYVLASNKTHSVRFFVEKAFSCIGKQITWSGSGVNEVGMDQFGKVLVRIDPTYFRPTEVDLLIGCPTKAQAELGSASANFN